MSTKPECGIAASCPVPVASRQCSACVYRSPLPPPEILVLMATRNERNWLKRTCESVQKTTRWLSEIIVRDDGSDWPQEVPSGVILERNPEPIGCAASRHQLSHNLRGKKFAFFVDPHMEFQDRQLDCMARIAQLTGSIVYAGCNGHYACDLMREDGILRSKWRKREHVLALHKRYQEATSFMGACYCFPTDILAQLGGWLYLPGLRGWDEEAMSILALKHGLTILADTGVQSYHEFREQPGDPKSPKCEYAVPAYDFYLNLAFAYRIVFEDALWTTMQPALRSFGVPRKCLREAERDGKEYGERVKERCKLNDLEFLLRIVPASET